MFPVPSNETLVETKTCKHCSAAFPITDKDLEFYEKISPTFGNQKYLIPSPSLCPDCRQQRRLSFRNERKLYKRRCDATGKDIVSIYSPDKPYKVYNQDFWWSDDWDSMEYGMDFDFGKSFFEQFGEMMKLVPIPNLQSVNDENSAYCNFTKSMKESYLAIGSSESQQSYYVYRTIRSQNVIDSSFIFDSSNISNSLNLTRCYNMKNSQNCLDSDECYYCFSCTDCHYCFGCTNLSNKSHCIFQIQYSPEQYEAELKIVQNMDPEEMRQRIQDQTISLAKEIIWSEDCIGDEIKNSKWCIWSFWIQDCENVRYGYDLYNHNKNAIDCFSWFWPAELSYESCSFWINSQWLIACENTFGTNNWIYLRYCLNSSNLFGCIGLRNKSYCILNKQYTKEEYGILVSKIIEHMRRTREWGESFPSSLSPFGYNETVAQEYFPLTREEAQVQNFNWSDYEAPFPKVEKIIPAAKLPGSIEDIPDDILNWAIECEVTRKPFRIIPQELEFYRKHNLPIPRRHPDQRHLDRIKLRNPRKLFERKCDCCGVDMFSTYAPERPETVYCEACYKKI